MHAPASSIVFLLREKPTCCQDWREHLAMKPSLNPAMWMRCPWTAGGQGRQVAGQPGLGGHTEKLTRAMLQAWHDI